MFSPALPRHKTAPPAWPQPPGTPRRKKAGWISTVFRTAPGVGMPGSPATADAPASRPCARSSGRGATETRSAVGVPSARRAALTLSLSKGASRARTRSRIASRSASGTHTAVSVPARCATASISASRRLVFTRSPGLPGISEAEGPACSVGTKGFVSVTPHSARTSRKNHFAISTSTGGGCEVVDTQSPAPPLTPGGPRRDPHRYPPGSAGRTAPVARLHQYHREHERDHSAGLPQRQTLAERGGAGSAPTRGVRRFASPPAMPQGSRRRFPPIRRRQRRWPVSAARRRRAGKRSVAAHPWDG